MKRVLAVITVAAVVLSGGPRAVEFASAEEGLPIVQQVWDQYIEAIGGWQRIEQLAGRTCSGIETTDLLSREQPLIEKHYFESYAVPSNKCLTMTWTGAGVVSSGFDGNAGWIKDRRGVRDDDEGVPRKLAFILNPHGALKILDYFPGLTVTGKREVEGRPTWVLEPHGLDKTYYALCFDVQTGLLSAIGQYWSLQDYRSVDGVSLPHRIVSSRKGGTTTLEFVQIRHDKDISDSLFARPVDDN